MKIESKVYEGLELRKTPPSTSIGGSKYKFTGNDNTIGFDDGVLSKHVAFLGSIGMGKTTAIMQLISQIKKQMGKDDVMIVFDSKGEFRTSNLEKSA